jgi:hypothetical protein
VTLPGVSLGAEDDPSIGVRLTRASVPLSAVVVTPGYFGMMVGSIAAPQTMSREQIETVPQIGEDIYRAVSRLPGVTASDFSANFYVRGGAGDELYASLDGVELMEPFHLKDLAGALSIVDSKAMGGVELTTGGFSAEYGDRLTGVFTLYSLDPRSETPMTSFGLSVMNARFMSQGGFANGRGGWLLSARRGYLDLALRLASADDSLSPRYYDVFGKVQYDLAHAGRIAAHVLLAGDDLRYLDSNDPNIRSSYGSNYAWLTWDGHPVTGLRQQTVVSLGRLTWRREGDAANAAGVQDFGVVDDRSLVTWGARSDWSLDFARRALLKWGVDARRESADYDYRRWQQREVIEAVHTVVNRLDSTDVALSPSGSRVGVYLAQRLRPVDALTVEAGVRWDRASWSGDVASPRLNVSLQPFARTVVRAAWGRYSQAQALYALQAQDGVTRFFQPEIADQRVLGVEQLLPGGITGRVEAYDRRLSHERPRFVNASSSIEMFPEATWDRMLVAPTSGRARGVELFLAGDGGAHSDWSVSYALARATDVVDGVVVPRAVDQRHTLHADWSFRPSSNAWRLSVAGVWHSGWPYTPQVLALDTLVNTDRQLTIFVTSKPGALNAGRLPAYQRLDLRWTRWFETSTGRLAFFAELYNAFGSRNTRGYFTSLDLSGRTVTTRVGSEGNVPRLPVIGLTWEIGGR